MLYQYVYQGLLKTLYFISTIETLETSVSVMVKYGTHDLKS